MGLRSPLGRVRGLGSAKEGTDHWWAQRLTSLALIPLTVWFVISIVGLTGADYAAVKSWAGSPVVAGLLILLIIATFYHSCLGLQVVIEDYVHSNGLRLFMLLGVRGASWFLAVIGVLSVLVLLLGEAPA